jgi:glycosyltransferase involved in cell wall biosynthesis
VTKDKLDKNVIAAQCRRRPFFSVIVPVWNRQDSVKRCLKSVFADDFEDYEIVVVDDASNDRSLDVIESFNDSRLRVIRHERNSGVCAARHTATNASQGQWILSLDSDWTLLPGALQSLARLAEKAPQDVGLIGGCAMSDQGEIWPGNPLPQGPYGFIEYVKWLDTSQPTDFLSCRRREVFVDLHWPTDRRLEMQFNLQVAKAWRGWVLSDVLAIAFTDCPNRYMTDLSQRGIERKLARAADEAKASEQILSEFGADLKYYVPRVYFNLLLATAHQNYCAGKRIRGLRYSLSSLFQQPWIPQVYARTFLGLMGPKTMATLGQCKTIQSVYRLVTRSI